jgi:cytoskeletal protein RodZ
VSVGADLVHAREQRGMSVEDISTATRIRSGLIRAIENDDFAPCGGAVYARGHIRSIARVLGIDPEPLVAEFDRLHAEEPAPVPVPNQPVEPDLAARADRRRPNWAAAMAASVLVIVIAVAGYSLASGSGSTGKLAGSGAGDLPTPTPRPSATASAPVSPPPSSVALVPRDAVALVRVTGDRTWLQVSTLDGRVLFQSILAHGQSRTFTDAKGLRLVIGNAPAVQFVADNTDFGVPRASGNVAHITVRPAGDVQFA